MKRLIGIHKKKFLHFHKNLIEHYLYNKKARKIIVQRKNKQSIKNNIERKTVFYF